MIDVLCVGAHPDDVEIGMGGAVAGMVRQGLTVAMVDLTDGEPTPKGTREIRLREAAAAASILGVVERRTLTQPNRSLSDTVAARQELAEVIRELKPRLLFGPYPVDSHPDHVAAASICDAARFYGKFVKSEMRGEPHFAAKVYHYAAVHLRLHLEPSFILDVSEDLPRKIEALRCYESQFLANPVNQRVLDRVELQAAYWGDLIGARAGEPFFCREPIGIDSLATLR